MGKHTVPPTAIQWITVILNHQDKINWKERLENEGLDLLKVAELKYVWNAMKPFQFAQRPLPPANGRSYKKPTKSEWIARIRWYFYNDDDCQQENTAAMEELRRTLPAPPPTAPKPSSSSKTPLTQQELTPNPSNVRNALAAALQSTEKPSAAPSSAKAAPAPTTATPNIQNSTTTFPTNVAAAMAATMTDPSRAMYASNPQVCWNGQKNTCPYAPRTYPPTMPPYLQFPFHPNFGQAPLPSLPLPMPQQMTPGSTTSPMNVLSANNQAATSSNSKKRPRVAMQNGSYYPSIPQGSGHRQNKPSQAMVAPTPLRAVKIEKIDPDDEDAMELEPLEQTLQQELMQVGFTDTREIQASIRRLKSSRAAAYSQQPQRQKPTMDEIMCDIIAQREEAEEARKMDEARLLSEQSRKEEARRRRKTIEETLQARILSSSPETWIHDKDMFPRSWILRGTARRAIDDDVTKRGDLKVTLIELLRLEKKARCWYGDVLPRRYFSEVLSGKLRMLTKSPDARKKLATEVETLQRALYNLSEQQGSIPRLFLETLDGAPKVEKNFPQWMADSDEEEEDSVIVEKVTAPVGHGQPKDSGKFTCNNPDIPPSHEIIEIL